MFAFWDGRFIIILYYFAMRVDGGSYFHGNLSVGGIAPAKQGMDAIMERSEIEMNPASDSRLRNEIQD